MEYCSIILLLPLFVFLLLGLGGHKMTPRTAGLIGTTGLFIVALLSYFTAFTYFSMPRVEGEYPTIIPFNFVWLNFTEHLHIDLGFLVDPLSVMMLVVVSTVSLMVHIYSMGYMHGEVGFQRYYAFLSLFRDGPGSAGVHRPRGEYFLPLRPARSCAAGRINV